MGYGAAIKQIRKEKGIKQYVLAECAGISQNTMSAIENNDQYPQAKTLDKICIALDTPLSLVQLLAIDFSDMPERYKAGFNKMYPSFKQLIVDIYEKD